MTAFSLVVSLFFFANIHKLRTATDLTDLFGNRDPQWRAASQIGKELGYGNQLFVLIEAPDVEAPEKAPEKEKEGPDATGKWRKRPTALPADMLTSGLFLHARSACGMKNCSTWCGTSRGIFRPSRSPSKRQI